MTTTAQAIQQQTQAVQAVSTDVKTGNQKLDAHALELAAIKAQNEKILGLLTQQSPPSGSGGTGSTPVPPVVIPPVVVPPSGNLILHADLSVAKSVAEAVAAARITSYVGSNVDTSMLEIANGGLHSKYPSGTNIVSNLMCNYPSSVKDSYIDVDVAYDTNFSTTGGGPNPTNAAAALKLVLPGLVAKGGRVTLDLTDGIQYQISLYADDAQGTFLPEFNSFDPPMGSQRWAVTDEFTSGAKYTYRVVVRYPTSTSMRVEAWFAKKGQLLVQKLYATSTCIRGTAPLVDRCEILNHFNQPRNFATGVTIYRVDVGTL